MSGQTGAQRALAAATTIPERVIFGRTQMMQAVRGRIEKVAQTAVPVLIVGESGVGKEVVARFIHDRSPWRQGPFLHVSCPATSESDLFNPEKGTVARMLASHPELVQSASGGTLFFDGIGELDLSLQSRLLDILRDSQSQPKEDLDGQRRVRIVCAASRPLEEEIAAGRFRRDLFYVLNVVTIPVPPLRDRRLDIPELVDYFLESYSGEFHRAPAPIRQATVDLLVSDDWPGNIRQLENLIKRYVILDSEEAILADLGRHLPFAHNFQDDVSLKNVTQNAKRDLERKVILDALSAHNWNRRKTAKALHISYRTLLYKIKQGGLSSKRSMSAATGKP